MEDTPSNHLCRDVMTLVDYSMSTAGPLSRHIPAVHVPAHTKGNAAARMMEQQRRRMYMGGGLSLPRMSNIGTIGQDVMSSCIVGRYSAILPLQRKHHYLYGD